MTSGLESCPMPVPDYQTLMRPLLEVLVDGAEHPLRDIKEKLAVHFALTPDERSWNRTFWPKGKNWRGTGVHLHRMDAYRGLFRPHEVE